MAGWRSVKVFLSSTFRDMHAERDHLVKVTFPAVRAALLPYRVELYDIDLRWGITEDEAKSAKTVGLCLDLVEECRPFFLAFLGHRYGWVPPSVPDDARRRYAVIDRHPTASVTEWEIRHALTDGPTAARALVLLRSEESVQSVPTGTRALFAEKTPAARDGLAALRKELSDGPVAVEAYSAQWNGTKFDSALGSSGRLDGLEYFGMLVEEWLLSAVRAELHLPDEPPAVDPLDAERDLHERYMELRTRCYVGRDAEYDRLAAFARADGDQPLLLTGPSGVGKSAALSHFVRRFRDEHPDVAVVAHFVGASPRTTSLPGMLQRLTAEIDRTLSARTGKAPGENGDRNEKAEGLRTPDELIRKFLALLTELPRDRRLVLVLDALNQLDADSRAETLVWLPPVLPPNVRVICSSATGPGQAPRVLTAFGERPYQAAELGPLSDGERRAILAAVPKLAAKVLDDAQVGRLLGNPATANPLYLTVALEELRGFGSYEKLNAKIAGLPRGEDAPAELFLTVFKRLETEFGRQLVASVLALLACSRRGLTDAELVELVRPLGPTAENLYPLLRQLDPYLHRRDGRFDFFHAGIRRAAERQYLDWRDEEDQWDPWRRWQPNRPVPAADPTAAEHEARRRLIAHFAADRLSPRAADELPWQLAQLRDWQGLFDLLSDLAFFKTAWEANEFEVRTAWSMVKAVGGLDPLDAYAEVLADPGAYDVVLLEAVVMWLLFSGHGERVAPVYGHFIAHFRAAGNHHALAVFLGNRAVAHTQAGEFAQADVLLAEQEAICRRLHLTEFLQMCLGNRGYAAMNVGDLDAAERFLGEQERICRRTRNAVGLQMCLSNRAVVRLSRNDPDGAAALCAEAETICRRLNDLTGLQRCLGSRALIRGTLGDTVGAGHLLEEQEAICRRIDDPLYLAGCLWQRATHLQNAADLPAALAVVTEQQAVCRRAGLTAVLQLGLGTEAMIRLTMGEPAAATALLAEQEDLCRRANTAASLQGCLGAQAKVAMATGDLPTALAKLDEQEAICRRIQTPSLLQECLATKAVVLKVSGRFADALALLAEQEDICRRGQIPAALQHSFGIQGELLFAMGQLPEADVMFVRQEEMSRELNLPAGVIHALGCRAIIRQITGDPAAALALYDEQEALCRRINLPLALQQCLATKATLLADTGRADEALRMLDEQEEICRRINVPEGMIQNRHIRALMAFARGDAATGLPLAEEALRLAEAHNLTVMADQIRLTVTRARTAPEAAGYRTAKAKPRAARPPVVPTIRPTKTVPPEVREIDERIAVLSAERDEAVANQRFEAAAVLRDQVNELTKRKDQLMRGFREKATEGTVEPPATGDGATGAPPAPRPDRGGKDTSRKRRGSDPN